MTDTKLLNIAKALVKFQSEVPNIELNQTVKVTTKTGGSYSFDYADLPNIVSTIKSKLAECGLSFSQLIQPDGLHTFIIHISGEYLKSICPIPQQTNNAQEYGSQITYIRRYALVSALGLVTEQDDDANSAVGNQVERTSPQPKQAVTQPTNEFKDVKCKDCNGEIAISKSTGKPYCKNRCWLPEGQHFRDAYQSTKQVEDITIDDIGMPF